MVTFTVIYHRPIRAAYLNSRRARGTQKYHVQEYLYVSVGEEQNLGANVEAFCCAFLDLFFLASSEAVEAHKGDVATLLTKIWDEHIRNQDLDPLVKKIWFANFTHLSIEIGVYSPFLSLYSLGKNVTFARSTNCSANGHPLLCA